jgi:Carbohydrate esterase, sialic acid-specific acetylesterase/Secretion system C-terminal sorting domain
MNFVKMRNPSIIFVLLLITFPAFSQITINFPLSRSVFQRDNKNSSVISITGNYSDVVEKMEARLVPIKQGQGVATDWTVITDKPEYGTFTGKLTGNGGWYELQVRGWKNGIVVAQSSVDRVGIGEVFLIAGQSNAQGRINFGEKSAIDDRVNCFDYFKSDYLDEIPPFKSFSHLDASKSIAPIGVGAWCWGELGDLLTKRLNVPVMFFNVAYEGTSIENWYSSSIGIPTVHPGYKFTFPNDTPYSYMRITFQYYISQLGIRAVLWCQGESELEFNTSEDYYTVALRRLIDKSRLEAGKKISWLIARTSLTKFTEVSKNVINAQNRVINPVDYIYEGPYTDSLQVPRPDGVHFRNLSGNEGLTVLAKAWDKKLTDNFFNQSIPFLPAPILQIKAVCSSLDKISLTLPSSYSFQRWSNNSTESTITTTSGTYNCIARDNTGNYFFTTTFDVKKAFPTKAPNIFPKTNLSFCDGTSIDLLTDNTDYSSFIWNTGEIQKQITVKTANRYSLRGINSIGCASPESNSLFTNIFPLTPKPVIYLSTTNTVCEGTTVTLASTGIGENTWNTNETSPNIVLSKAGDYNITVRTKDSNGCLSTSADVVKVNIIARPEVPEITQVGAYTLQAKQKNYLSTVSFEWKSDGTLLSNKTAFIKAAKPSFLTVTAIQNFPVSNTTSLNCRSNISGAFSFIPDLSISNVIIYPNPTQDGLVTLEAKENLLDLALIVYTTQGKYIYSTPIPALTERRLVDLSFLSDGIYIIKLRNTIFEETRTIVVEKK